MFTQYMFNPYILNPAAGGAYLDTEAMIGYRNQWTGFEDAPKTMYFTMHGTFGQAKRRVRRGPRRGSRSSRSMGNYHSVGGNVFNDVTGPTSHSGLYLSYAYHIELDAGVHLSLGTYLGVLQYALDTDKIVLADNSNDLDNALGTGRQTEFLPDAALGMYLHSKDYFLGLSLRQLLQNKFNYNELIEDKYSQLRNHYYLTGGYNFVLDRDWTIQPSTLVKYSEPADVQVDVNLKVIYQNMFWGGLSYRTKESVSALLGVTLQESISLGYSYDYGIDQIGKYHGGSHEIVLGYRITQ